MLKPIKDADAGGSQEKFIGLTISASLHVPKLTIGLVGGGRSGTPPPLEKVVV